MCNGRVAFEPLAEMYPMEARLDHLFEDSLAHLVGKGLIEYDGNVLTLTDKGLWVARYVAMHLDLFSTIESRVRNSLGLCDKMTRLVTNCHCFYQVYL